MLKTTVAGLIFAALPIQEPQQIRIEIKCDDAANTCIVKKDQLQFILNHNNAVTRELRKCQVGRST